MQPFVSLRALTNLEQVHDRQYFLLQVGVSGTCAPELNLVAHENDWFLRRRTTCQECLTLANHSHTRGLPVSLNLRISGNQQVVTLLKVSGRETSYTRHTTSAFVASDVS